MLFDENQNRELRTLSMQFDLVVVGGGIAGVCAAITAARQEIRVALVQDRPVLGGNASSEVRLWMVGATSHMGNNNRWAREGGVLNEILLENCYRNNDGNPVFFDALLLEKVTEEPNITLLLNTCVHELDRHDDGAIRSVTGFCSQNSTRYVLEAKLFCDSSGDGIVGFLAGAAFRIGAEAQEEFNERLAPPVSSQQLLGHSIYFYTRDTGRLAPFVRPSFALDDITQIPRYRRFNCKEQGTDLWWIEYGGSLDTVHDTEKIKWELWKVIYGVWDHIKNSGDFPEAETLTIDWIGLIPGKRESRRFEGDYMLVQQDVVEQRTHFDAVSYGGWAIDHHPVDNIYSDKAPCTQWHSKGVYQIPYRTMYSRNVSNLFLAGRLISASHIAFGSSRVMATCGHNGQAVGAAAALCIEGNCNPCELATPERIGELQLRLLRTGQFIPQLSRTDKRDLAQTASLHPSSVLKAISLPPAGTRALREPRALLVPLTAGKAPCFKLRVRHSHATNLRVRLMTCSRTHSHTPDTVLDEIEIPLPVAESGGMHVNGRVISGSPMTVRGPHKVPATVAATTAKKSFSPAIESGDGTELEQSPWTDATVDLKFNAMLDHDCYAFVALDANEKVEVYESEGLVAGVTTVSNRQNAKVSKSSRQCPPAGSGIDEFDYWTAERRPLGRNLSADLEVGELTFAASNVVNGLQRPTDKPNAWVSSLNDPTPCLTLRWNSPIRLRSIALVFDPDWDHPLENIVMRHSERVMPTLVRDFRILDAGWNLLAEYRDNHQCEVVTVLSEPLETDKIRIELKHPSTNVPASLYEVRCYEDAMATNEVLS